MGPSKSSLLHHLLAIQLILTLWASFINGYVVRRLADLHELKSFPSLRLLDSAGEFAPLPLVIAEFGDAPKKRSYSTRSIKTDEELKHRRAKLRNSDQQQQQQQLDEMPKTYAKKSQQLGYKLKKFNNVGSRNCFFSPIQCLVQFDMSKYKKLVDTSSMRFASAPTLEE